MKVVKIKGLCSRPLQQRVLMAAEPERSALLDAVHKESGWMISKMQRKGFTLEATVAGVFGVFTRGPATGTIALEDRIAAKQ